MTVHKAHQRRSIGRKGNELITEEGDYLSDPSAYDLRPHFKHLHWRVMPHSQGHLVASDWWDQPKNGQFALYKNCGLWTRDEAALLMKIALQVRGEWVDIGAHTGWTSKHINWGTNRYVACVDPMLRVKPFYDRFLDNTGFPISWAWGVTSNDFFARQAKDSKWRGFCIDGDHGIGKPLEDAKNSAARIQAGGVVVFHDFVGQPVREAVLWLMNQGWKARVYDTPHGVAICWPDMLIPPDHTPDPRVPWAELRKSMPDFDFTRTV